MKSCKPNCDFEKALNVSRAKWICATCKRDLGIEYIFYVMCAHPEWFKKEVKE